MSRRTSSLEDPRPPPSILVKRTPEWPLGMERVELREHVIRAQAVAEAEDEAEHQRAVTPVSCRASNQCVAHLVQALGHAMSSLAALLPPNELDLYRDNFAM